MRIKWGKDEDKEVKNEDKRVEDEDKGGEAGKMRIKG